MTVLDAWEYAARLFEPRARRWATPGVMAAELDPATIQTPALDVIDQELVALADGQCDRLMIFMSPQEGKSVRVSQRYVEWLLADNPDLRVAIVSYADEMARRWGSDIKLDLETFNGFEGTADLGLRLRADSRAAGRWQINGRKGGVYCVGIGGALTGKPVDVLVIDDPIKDLEQAQSSRYRDRAKRFWQGVAVPRLGPGAKCVLIQTRWHEEDLAGWLLQQEPGRWRVVSIPAIAESADDPLGRKPGEAMVSARGNRDWAGIRASVGEYVWAALYQQRPAPAAGGLFKRAALRHWRSLPADASGAWLEVNGRGVRLTECWRFITVDLAASTKTSADYTVAGVWGITPFGDLVLLDGDRGHIEESAHWDMVRGLRERWSAETVFVESRMFGTTLVYAAGRNGVPIQELKPDADKVTRAIPAAACADRGQLWLPPVEAAPWVTDWVDELVAFPNGAHDDVVDVVAYAARVVEAHWLPAEPPPRPASAGGGVSQQAYEAALGGRTDVTDFMTMQY